jgi:hypothetical protein
MARPTWIAAGRFGRHNGGQLPSIVLVLESKMQLRMADSLTIVAKSPVGFCVLTRRLSTECSAFGPLDRNR